MRFDLTDLRLFLSVVDAGSITQGAARVHLSLASASERLRGLEQDAGIPLLARHARGVSTTDAGEALAHHARLILRQQALLQGELRDFALGSQGTVHLHANTAALADFLPQRLAPWLAEHPRLNVELKERTSAEIVRAIAAGRAEAGIVSSATEAPGLVLQPVADDHLVLIAPAAHALADTRSARLADVLGEPFVGLEPGSALQEHINEQARRAGREPAFRVRMKTFEGLCDMVAHGVGLGIIPRSIATRLRRRYRFGVVALEEVWARRQLCLCFENWAALSPAMQNLLRHLGATPP
ncbi:MAG: LysR family transcriptional regulator [Comamonas sp.]